MITAYLSQNNFKPETITMDNVRLLNDALWIDLINPTKDEEHLVEECIDLNIPTREEMQEIEISSRLYKEDNTLFMTATMVEKSASPEPKADAVTLILFNNKLITVRYIEPQSFALLASRLSKLPHQERYTASFILIELLDASIDRLADILEFVSTNLEQYSHLIFHNHDKNHEPSRPDYKELLQKIGTNGDLNTKVQESLITFNRLIMFFAKKISDNTNENTQKELSMLTADIHSLIEHVSFLSNKVTFLLDATLGMVNIEQNNIIKIFSISAVVLLPPTLVASIYGMNFEIIPELKWRFGYPFAIALMFVSAWLPYKFFKAKKWL